MDADQFSRLIQAIYAAAFEADGWSRLAELIATQFQAESCVLSLEDWAGAVGILGAAGGAGDNPGCRLRYRRPSADGGRRPLPVPGERRDPSGKGDLGPFLLIGRLADAMPGAVGMIAIRRPDGAVPFGAEEGHVLRLLVPHLVRAVCLHCRLEQANREHRLTLSAFDACGIGVMAVRADGRLLFASRLAERKLRDCSAVSAHHGYLHAGPRGVDGRLARFVRDAAAGGDGTVGLLPVEGDDGRAMSLLVCPPAGEVASGPGADPVALVFVTDAGDCAAITPSVLARFYGLTPAEARLMAALLEGEQLDGYSQRLGISRETARTLLKRIFGKTGHSRQADLIRCALGNPLLRMGSGRQAGEVDGRY